MSELPNWFEEMEELTDKITKNMLSPEDSDQTLHDFWSRLLYETKDENIMFFQKLIELAKELIDGAIDSNDYQTLAKKLRNDFMDKYTDEEKG